MPDGLNPTAPDLSSLNYTVLQPYNGTINTGGDSLADNVNIFYEVSFYITHLQVHYEASN